MPSSGFTVDGTLTIPETPVFEIRNAVYSGGTLVIPVCTATACEGAENLRGATLIGVPEIARAKAKFANGLLYVEMCAKGLIMWIQ